LVGPHTAQIAHLGCRRRRQAGRRGSENKKLYCWDSPHSLILMSPMSPMSPLRVCRRRAERREGPLSSMRAHRARTRAQWGGGGTELCGVGVSRGCLAVPCLRDTAGALPSHRGACARVYSRVLRSRVPWCAGVLRSSRSNICTRGEGHTDDVRFAKRKRFL